MKGSWWLFLLAIVVAVNSNWIDRQMKQWIPDGKKRARMLFWFGTAMLTLAGVFVGMAVSMIWPIWAAVTAGLLPVGILLLTWLYVRKKGGGL